uniref:Putative 1 n=1 Tax=Ixodes ricinus TaxID=34613 RepID=V5HC66_IXORI
MGTRLIVAMFVLFAVCKPTVTGVELKGAHNMAPNCEKQIKDLCNNSSLGALEVVDVAPRNCKVTCTYRPSRKKICATGGMYWFRTLNLKKLICHKECHALLGRHVTSSGTAFCRSFLSN